MKQELEKICKLLDDGAYKDEQHVRFSLVGRICQKLGWDIWDPQEFYTEYPIEIPDPNNYGQMISKKIDVVLNKKKGNDYDPHILMEIKSVGSLQTWTNKSRKQLELYSSKFQESISILTDGQRWEFYLNCLKTIKSDYDDCLINAIDLLHDDVESLAKIFTELLSPDKTKAALKKTGLKMRREHEIKCYIMEAIPIVLETKNDVSMLSHDVYDKILELHRKTKPVKSEYKGCWKKLVNTDSLQAIIQKIDGRKGQNPELPKGKELMFHIKKRDIKAFCIYDSNTKLFTLQAGSEVVRMPNDSFTGKILKQREQMIENGDLYLNTSQSKYILKKPLSFKKVSPTSSFILASSSNGFEEWIDDRGKTLDSYRHSLGIKKSIRNRKP